MCGMQSKACCIFSGKMRNRRNLRQQTECNHPTCYTRLHESLPTSYTHKNLQNYTILVCTQQYSAKKSKYWDMHHHWLQDKETREYIRVFWESEDTNDTHKITKYPPTIYHRLMHPKYIQNKVIQAVNMITFAL